MANSNFILSQFFNVNGLDKVTVTKKGNVYKKEAFNKAIREYFPQYLENGEIPASKYKALANKTHKKLRLCLLQILEMFNAQKTIEAQKKFAIQFAKFYSEFYIVNDYTLLSVTNGRMSEDSQQLIAKQLPKIHALLEEQKALKTTEKKK